MNAAREVKTIRPISDDDLDHALARQLARATRYWARSAGLDAAQGKLLAGVAEKLATEMETGHVCLHIEELENTEKAQPAAHQSPLARERERGGGEGNGHDQSIPIRETLLATRLVAEAQDPQPLPFVLDADGRFYLHRYYDYEVRLASALLRLLDAPQQPCLPPAVLSLLPKLFPTSIEAMPAPLSPDPSPAKGEGRKETNWQKIAVLRALTSRLTIICGGPGTGKTRSVANYLACKLHADPKTRVALTAPTGKAATRMEEALRQRFDELTDKVPPELAARLPRESFTLHRLLGFNPSTGKPRYHLENPLPYEVIIVDEASMIDIALATHLVEALPENATLLILGDRDQLAAVEKGVVLGALASGGGRRIVGGNAAGA